MSKKLKIIKKCRACFSPLLEPVITLGDLYLSNFTNSNNYPEKFPLTVLLCKTCSLLQLENTTPLELLYNDNYGYLSGTNQTMRDELKDIVDKSLMHFNPKNKNITVMDIGANDGTLLSYYPKKYTRIAVEPVKKLAKISSNIADIVINDFFSKDSYNIHSTDKIEIITAISCFYDLENPNTFLSDVKNLLQPNGILTIQQNYLVSMIAQNAFDNIVHEHLEYYSLTSLSKLLEKYDLEIFDVELRDLNGGSIRTFIAHKGQKTISNKVIELCQIEKMINLQRKKVYIDFAKRINTLKKSITQYIEDLVKNGKTVYVYGASTRGNTLLQYFGLDHKLIKKAVERNPEKWGKSIDSVAIPIISEEQARKEHPDYMLVLPWFFKEEFLMREQEYLKKGGHFIFPLPEMKVI